MTAEDHGDLPFTQFLWKIGDFEPDPSSIPNVQEQARFLNRNDVWDEGWRVNGWIGTVRQPKQLDHEDAGNLNGIAVFARGRLFS